MNSVDDALPLSPKKLRTRTAAAKPADEKPAAAEKPRAAATARQTAAAAKQPATATKQPAAATKQPAKTSASGRPVGRPPSASTTATAAAAKPAATATTSQRNTAANATVSNPADDGKKVPRYYHCRMCGCVRARVLIG